MKQRINNLDELLREKARLRMQLDIVKNELQGSTRRTRQEFKTLLEDKFSLSNLLAGWLNGGVRQVAESGAAGALGRVVSGGSWWGGLVASLLPVVVGFLRKQVEKRGKKTKKTA